MLPVIALAIFLLQGAVLVADEVVYHRQRGLPRWERLGHPLDTLSVLICLGVTLAFPPQAPWIYWYAGLAIFSCLCVTKDEWVHAITCRPAEHWLHAWLFLLHPALLWAVYALWRDGHLALLRLDAALCLLFGLYQFTYWNLPWRNRPLPQ